MKKVITVKVLQFFPAVTRSNENGNCVVKKNSLFYVAGVYANLRLKIWSLLCRSSPSSAVDISAELMVSQPTECLSVSDCKEFVTKLMKIVQLTSKILTAVIESGTDEPSRKEGWCRNKGTKK